MVAESSDGADKEFREAVGKDMIAALDGKCTIELASLFTKTISSLVRISLEFLLNHMFFSIDELDVKHWSKEIIFEWMRKVKKTPTVYVAKEGLGATIGDDLGACTVYEDSKVACMDGNHFSFLVNLELHQQLQEHDLLDSPQNLLQFGPNITLTT